jgi:NADPH-dependent curcumin reductase CurA
MLTKTDKDMNRQWRLARRPIGISKTTDFELTDAPIPSLQEGEALVRTELLSMDPTNRIWLYEQSTYFPPQELGEIVRGIGIGTVVDSKMEALKKGSKIISLLGWQDYKIISGNDSWTPVIELPGVPLTWNFGPFGMHGITAYFGLLDVGKPKTGETILISGAAGAVGSLVGQIGKIHGCRVVGIAGSDEKCNWITRDLGFDRAINYREEKSMTDAIARACPDGVDVYFDNVGGVILEAALDRINLRGRVVVCGMISCYNESNGDGYDLHAPRNLLRLVYQRARIEGFLVLDYMHRAEEAVTRMLQWFQEGKIQYRVEIDHGLENAPETMNKLFNGNHNGKLILQVA